jgi:hypothetical protein
MYLTGFFDRFALVKTAAKVLLTIHGMVLFIYDSKAIPFGVFTCLSV